MNLHILHHYLPISVAVRVVRAVMPAAAVKITAVVAVPPAHPATGDIYQDDQ
jgi:hypothetical protein